MSKLVSSRILFWLPLAAAILVAALGIYQGAYMIWARRTVEYALSGRPGSNAAEEKIKKLGERAVPLVLSEMRLHVGPEGPNDLTPMYGEELLRKMAMARELDPRVPYLARVVSNPDENEYIRETAARILSCAWYSEEARELLSSLGLHDPSARIRSACLNQLGYLADYKALKTKDWRVDPLVVYSLEAGVRDRDPSVRENACMAAGMLATMARDNGTTLEWAESLVVQCSKDPDPMVRAESAWSIRELRARQRR